MIGLIDQSRYQLGFFDIKLISPRGNFKKYNEHGKCEKTWETKTPENHDLGKIA